MTTTPLPPTAPVNEAIDQAASADGRPRRLSRLEKRAIATKGKLSSPWASFLAIVIAILWTVPSIGLLVTSFRPELDIRRSGWWTAFGGLFSGETEFTLDNYEQALFGSGANLAEYFVNSFVITIPAVIIPITIALLAAYAFAWMDFPFRNALFVAVFALQIVPLQVALIPLLDIYTNGLSLQGGERYWSVWISHTIFALPLATFIIHNFMKDIPKELLEAARVDGAGHVRIFFQLLMPLLTPALAAFGIFQFLWVWNDLLVSLVFLGGTQEVRPLIVHVAELSGTRGNAWFLLSAGAFISMVVPVAVFLALQRYFVRGLLAGGLKG